MMTDGVETQLKQANTKNILFYTVQIEAEYSTVPKVSSTS